MVVYSCTCSHTSLISVAALNRDLPEPLPDEARCKEAGIGAAGARRHHHRQGYVGTGVLATSSKFYPFQEL